MVWLGVVAQTPQILAFKGWMQEGSKFEGSLSIQRTQGFVTMMKPFENKRGLFYAGAVWREASLACSRPKPGPQTVIRYGLDHVSCVLFPAHTAVFKDIIQSISWKSE